MNPTPFHRRQPCRWLLAAAWLLIGSTACSRAPSPGDAAPAAASAAAPARLDEQAARSTLPHAQLAVVTPIIACDALASADLGGTTDGKVSITATSELATPKGRFCKVEGSIAPSIGFEVDLPMERWTQRFLQGGCGGLCGMTSVGITNAGTCGPALDGEFVVAGNDMGHKGAMGSADEAAFGADPQKRIDFAYRGNHQTALVAKALIQAYYGQAPRYAYFMGCSDGGREALMEAQRYPDDFDGIAAGAPAAIFQLQNSFHHAWTALANTRADGSNILLRNRIGIVHDAVLAHCPTLSGVADGLLQDPRACVFDPAWVQCADGASDTSKCLSAEEVAVVQKIYQGPADAEGHRFAIGGAQPGSESSWMLPASADAASDAMSGGMASRSLQYLIMPEVDAAAGDLSTFRFDMATFRRIAALAPLYNATNTNLLPFQQHGGKLILWHGLADTSINPSISVAYYQGVQRQLGEKLTDGFLRLFLLPGIGHCGGGDGYGQVDLLSPLMAWTEMQQAPAQLLAGKSSQGAGPGAGGPPPGGPGGPGAGGPPPGGPGGPGAGGPPPGGPAGPGAPGAGGPPPAGAGDMSAGPGAPPPGMAAGPGASDDRKQEPPRMHVEAMPSNPVATAAIKPDATRPVYPYPAIARYTGNGDPDDAANYAPAASPVALPQAFAAPAAELIGPDNQKTWHVVDGKLVAD